MNGFFFANKYLHQIIIEAEVGENSLGDIAIDEIALKENACPSNDKKYIFYIFLNNLFFLILKLRLKAQANSRVTAHSKLTSAVGVTLNFVSEWMNWTGNEQLPLQPELQALITH